MGKLRNGKEGGSSNILPEMTKTVYGNKEIRALLLDFIHTVWEERQVIRKWAGASFSPAPRRAT